MTYRYQIESRYIPAASEIGTASEPSPLEDRRVIAVLGLSEKQGLTAHLDKGATYDVITERKIS